MMQNSFGILFVLLSAIFINACQSSSEIESTVNTDNHSVVTIQDKLSSDKLAPELVVIPTGTHTLGDISGIGIEVEQPTYKVTIEKPFAIGKYEVTFEEYDYFCDMTGRRKPDSEGWGRGKRPVIDVTWYDAQEYVEWLTRRTGEHYFLPSEAQWEYAARAGTITNYWWGDEAGDKNAQCGDCAAIHRCVDCKNVPLIDEGTVKVGSFRPNQFGLYDVHGNVAEWTADCGNHRNSSTPSQGYPRSTGDCSAHVMKDGSWFNNIRFIRSSVRVIPPDGNEYQGKHVGFRVAREIK